MIGQPKDLLTAREVAARIGVGLRTVWRWTATGDLPAPVRWGRNGRVVRWKTIDIEQFVQALPVRRKR
jgi:excisionase family DNA binding protein